MTKSSVRAGRTSASRPATMLDLFQEYDAYSLRVRNTAPESVKARRLYLDRAVELLSVEESAESLFAVAPNDLMAAVTDYSAIHQGEGSRRYFQYALRALLKFCYLQGFTDSDLSGWVPSRRRIRLASIPKAIPDDMIVRLKASISPDSLNGRRDAAIIAILAAYGVRGIQVRKLQLSDIDWDTDLISFPACKRGKPIIQSLSAEVGNRLADYLRLERPAITGRPEVFVSHKEPYLPFTSSGPFSRLVARRFKEARIQLPEGVSCGTHGFRHAFASRLCGKIPFKHISDMLGHRDYSSVQIYAKINFDDLAQTALPWPEGGVQ